MEQTSEINWASNDVSSENDISYYRIEILLIDYEPLSYLRSKDTFEYEVSCPFYDYRRYIFSLVWNREALLSWIMLTSICYGNNNAITNCQTWLRSEVKKQVV